MVRELLIDSQFIMRYKIIVITTLVSLLAYHDTQRQGSISYQSSIKATNR